jgi:hypothetical protein
LDSCIAQENLADLCSSEPGVTFGCAIGTISSFHPKLSAAASRNEPAALIADPSADHDVNSFNLSACVNALLILTLFHCY